MKYLFLFCLILTTAAQTGLCAKNELIQNSGAAYFPEVQDKYSTLYIKRSTLSLIEEYKVLGIPLNLSESAVKAKMNETRCSTGLKQPQRTLDSVERMFFRAIHYALGVKLENLENDDSKKWDNLSEKRYSILRGLLTTISNLTEGSWIALDFRGADKSYIFEGRLGELLIIKPKTGAFYFAHRYKVFTNQEKPLLPDYKNAFLVKRKKLFCSYLLQP